MDEKRYFLKCDGCGYLTEIIDENQTWCPNCTKRLPNYYKSWRPEEGQKTLDRYKELICISYLPSDVRRVVDPNNRKTEIKNPTKEQIVRRAYLKDGIPLDTGGHYQWDWGQLKMFAMWIAIVLGAFLLIVYLIRLF